MDGNDPFSRELRSARDRIAELQRRSTADTRPGGGLLPEALAELDGAIEELSVTGQELHEQTAELTATRLALESERERYQALFEFAPVAYLVTDPVARILEANRAAAALLDVDQRFLVGKPLAAYVASEDRWEFRSMVNSLRRADGSGVANLSVQFRRRSGGVTDIAVTVQPVRDRSGVLLTLRWILRDRRPLWAGTRRGGRRAGGGTGRRSQTARGGVGRAGPVGRPRRDRPGPARRRRSPTGRRRGRPHAGRRARAVACLRRVRRGQPRVPSGPGAPGQRAVLACRPAGTVGSQRPHWRRCALATAGGGRGRQRHRRRPGHADRVVRRADRRLHPVLVLQDLGRRRGLGGRGLCLDLGCRARAGRRGPAHHRAVAPIAGDPPAARSRRSRPRAP